MEKETRNERMLSNREDDVFFAQQTPEILRAVCRGLCGEQCPAVHVSQALMVLGQTKAGGRLFAECAFYCVESFLPHEAGQLIRQCMAQHTEQEQLVLLDGRQWNMRVIPVESGAVLVFVEAQRSTAGITLATADLRDRAANLLIQADRLDRLEQPDIAAEIRREAYRMLRSIGHLELLAGAPEGMQWKERSVSSFIKELRKQLKRHAEIRVIAPQCDEKMQADTHLLCAAILSLVSNSLRHGGEQVHVTVSVEIAENSVTFRVDDDGAGIPDAVMQRINSTWEQADALPGGWGLGIPYVRRIAMMHGGILVYVQMEQTGTHARLRIPLRQSDPAMLESGCAYRRSSANEADIELSSALDAAYFRRD